MSGGFVDLTLEPDSEEDEPLVVLLPFEFQKRPGMTKRWKSLFFACIALKSDGSSSRAHTGGRASNVRNDFKNCTH